MGLRVEEGVSREERGNCNVEFKVKGEEEEEDKDRKVESEEGGRKRKLRKDGGSEIR